jgi:hypothetical protein
MLEHVAGEEIGVADLVERRNERERPQREGEQKEQEPRPAGVIGAPASPEADERPHEEQQREPGAGEHDRRRIPR